MKAELAGQAAAYELDRQRLDRHLGPRPLQVLYGQKIQPIVRSGAERLAKPDQSAIAERSGNNHLRWVAGDPLDSFQQCRFAKVSAPMFFLRSKMSTII
jgi:hypothetical protein